MEIKRVTIGGNREQIDKLTGEHIPNLLDNVKRSDLIYTPEKLIKKMFKGGEEEYDIWLMKHKLHPSQINYYDINQKQELIKRLKIYTMRLLNEAKNDSMFYNVLGKFIISKWLDTVDILENHIYDLGDFDKIEFLKIVDTFKKRFNTNSPFAFLTIDEVNQQLKIVESHKVLLLLEEKLPMGSKRGTPIGQQPERLYQNFFTAIGYKGKGELTEGLNYHRTSFKNFNFNMNIEVRLLNDIIYDILKYDRKETQIAFLFGAYGKKLYFESDIKGTQRTKEENEALSIVKDTVRVIEKELHKERQGSIAVDKTPIEVKKRVEHPKTTPTVSNQFVSKDLEEEEFEFSISNTLEAFKKEIFKKQKGYVELAKDKINEALANRNQYIEEFYAFLDKGMSVSDALGKFSERYANNPYIKGVIETTITGELRLQSLKDRGIDELNSIISRLKERIEELKINLGEKENEIASLNQTIEATIVSHTKQLEKIEVNIAKFIEDREKLIEKNSEQVDIIYKLEKLISQYQHDIKYYKRQIEHLKEENDLALSTTKLLKMSNRELKDKIEKLMDK